MPPVPPRALVSSHSMSTFPEMSTSGLAPSVASGKTTRTRGRREWFREPSSTGTRWRTKEGTRHARAMGVTRRRPKPRERMTTK
jgi:hypothetical protein